MVSGPKYGTSGREGSSSIGTSYGAGGSPDVPGNPHTRRSLVGSYPGCIQKSSQRPVFSGGSAPVGPDFLTLAGEIVGGQAAGRGRGRGNSAGRQSSGAGRAGEQQGSRGARGKQGSRGARGTPGSGGARAQGRGINASSGEGATHLVCRSATFRRRARREGAVPRTMCSGPLLPQAPTGWWARVRPMRRTSKRPGSFPSLSSHRSTLQGH